MQIDPGQEVDWVKWVLGLFVPVFTGGLWASHSFLSKKMDTLNDKMAAQALTRVTDIQEADGRIWDAIEKLRTDFQAHQMDVNRFHVEFASKMGQLASRDDISVIAERVASSLRRGYYDGHRPQP